MPQYMILQDEIERIHIKSNGMFVRPTDVLNKIVDAYNAIASDCADVRFSFCNTEIEARRLSPDSVRFEVVR